MADTKFCKDCRHSAIPDSVDVYKMTCNSPYNSVEYSDASKYLVTGLEQQTVLAMRGATCSALRQDRGPIVNATVCGPDGKWFEEK